MHHVKSLDGLRGAAISFVLLFHAGFFQPGWTGVQLFFVLSGFLITDILVRTKTTPIQIYLARFYWRRALRIFPVYFLFILAMAIFFLVLGEPDSFSRDWPFLVTYTANFGRLRVSDVGSEFVHLWSLAVEEQFYIFWPMLVYLLPERFFKRLLIVFVVGAPLLRLALYLVFEKHDQVWIGRNIYSLPFTQFDAFASGAAISVWRLQEARHPARLFVTLLALTSACGAFVLLHDHYLYKNAIKGSLGYAMYLMQDWGFVWGYSLLNFLSAAVIICALRRISVFRLFELQFLTKLGKISYGVYVYHVPILVLTGWLFSIYNLSKSLLFPAYIGITLLVGSVSYRWLELPFLKLKDSRPLANSSIEPSRL